MIAMPSEYIDSARERAELRARDDRASLEKGTWEMVTIVIHSTAQGKSFADAIFCISGHLAANAVPQRYRTLKHPSGGEKPRCTSRGKSEAIYAASNWR